MWLCHCSILVLSPLGINQGVAKELNRHFTDEEMQSVNKYMKKMFNIPSKYRNANQNYSKVFHLDPVRMVIIKSTSNNKCWQGCGENGTLINCWWDCKLVLPLWKAVWRFLKNLGMESPLYPVVSLFSLYPKSFKSAHYSDTATSMFIAAQFTIAKLWN